MATIKNIVAAAIISSNEVDGAVRTKTWTPNPMYNNLANCQKLDSTATDCTAYDGKEYDECDYTSASSGCKTPTKDKYGYKGPAFSNFKMCEGDDVLDNTLSQCTSTDDVMYGHVRLSGFEHISISDSCASYYSTMEALAVKQVNNRDSTYCKAIGNMGSTKEWSITATLFDAPEFNDVPTSVAAQHAINKGQALIDWGSSNGEFLDADGTAKTRVKQAHGFIGGSYSGTSMKVSGGLAVNDYATIAISATNPALSVKSGNAGFPNFFRTTPPDSVKSKVIATWLKKWEIKAAFVITVDDDFPKGLQTAFKEYATSNGIEAIEPKSIGYLPASMNKGYDKTVKQPDVCGDACDCSTAGHCKSPIDAILDELNGAKTRTVVLCSVASQVAKYDPDEDTDNQIGGKYAKGIVPEARAKGMMDGSKGWIWIHPDPIGVSGMMEGLFSVTGSATQTPAWKDQKYWTNPADKSTATAYTEPPALALEKEQTAGGNNIFSKAGDGYYFNHLYTNILSTKRGENRDSTSPAAQGVYNFNGVRTSTNCRGYGYFGYDIVVMYAVAVDAGIKLGRFDPTIADIDENGNLKDYSADATKNGKTVTATKIKTLLKELSTGFKDGKTSGEEVMVPTVGVLASADAKCEASHKCVNIRDYYSPCLAGSGGMKFEWNANLKQERTSDFDIVNMLGPEAAQEVAGKVAHPDLGAKYSTCTRTIGVAEVVVVCSGTGKNTDCTDMALRSKMTCGANTFSEAPFTEAFNIVPGIKLQFGSPAQDNTKDKKLATTYSNLPAEYSKNTNNGAPPNCEPGNYLSNGVCVKTVVGYYNTNDDYLATKCEAGKKCPTEGLAAPVSCEPGTWQDLSGQTECKKCKINQEQPANAMTTECNNCRSGTLAKSEGTANCEQCPYNTYLDWTGVTDEARTKKLSCDECNANLRTFMKGAEIKSDCVPKDGYYFRDNTKANSLALKCPHEVDCSWSAAEAATLGMGVNQRGFMVLGADTQDGNRDFSVWKCSKERRCPSMQMVAGEDTCVGDFQKGIGCSECVANYYYDDGKCQKCGSSGSKALGALVFIVAFFVFVGGCYMFCCPSHEIFCPEQVHVRVIGLKATAVLGIVVGNITSFQILYEVGSDSFGKITEWALNLNDHLFGWFESPVNLQCQGTHANDAVVLQVVLKNMMPAAFLFIVAVIFLTLRNRQSLSQKRRPTSAGAIGLVLGVFEMFFVIISKNAAAAGFDRIEHPNGQKSLTIRPSLLTTDSRADSIVIISALGVLLWVFTYLATVLWMVRQAPKRVSTDKTFALAMISYFARFDERNYSFTLVLLIRRFLIGITGTVGVVGLDTPQLKMFWMIVVMVVAMTVNDRLQPYRFHVLHRVDQISMGGMVCAIAAAAITAPKDAEKHDGLIFTILGVTYLYCMWCLVIACKKYYVARQSMVYKKYGKGRQSIAKLASNRSLGQFDLDHDAMMQPRVTKEHVDMIKAILDNEKKNAVADGRKQSSGDHSEALGNFSLKNIEKIPVDVRARMLIGTLPDDLLDALDRISREVKISEGSGVHIAWLLRHAEKNEGTEMKRAVSSNEGDLANLATQAGMAEQGALRSKVEDSKVANTVSPEWAVGTPMMSKDSENAVGIPVGELKDQNRERTQGTGSSDVQLAVGV